MSSDIKERPLPNIEVPRGPIVLKDGRYILIQEWSPTVDLDPRVLITIKGLLMPAPRAEEA